MADYMRLLGSVASQPDLHAEFGTTQLSARRLHRPQGGLLAFPTASLSFMSLFLASLHWPHLT